MINNPFQLMEELDHAIDELENKTQDLVKLAEAKADKERTYRRLKAKKLIMLRAEGTPVALLSDLTKGDEEVSDAKFHMDMAESTYFIAIESLKTTRNDIESLRSKLAWLRSELNNQT